MKKNKLLAVLLALAMTLTLLPVSVLAEESNTVTVDSHETAQAALDAATDGTTIKLTGGVNYGALLIRPVLGAGHTVSGDWYNPNYATELARTIENVTIIGAAGATVDEIKVDVGYKGSNYIHEAPDLMSYANIKNLVIDGVEFTDNNSNTGLSYKSPIYINLQNTNLDGLTVKNCKLIGEDDKCQLVYIYTDRVNHTFTTASKNVTITGNTVDGIARLCELRGTENVAITNNIIKNTAEHAMLLAGDGYSGTVTITGNTAVGNGERFVRMSGADGATVTIANNTVSNYLGRDPDFIKVTKADSTNITASVASNNTLVYVAQIGETKYATLAAAIGAAKPGQTVTLLTHVTQDDGVNIDKDLVLDLNNKTFTVKTGNSTNSRNIKITGSANVTIKNGSMVAEGSGTTEDTGSGCYGTVRFESSGKLTMNDLSLYNSRPYGLNVKVTSGTAELNNVTIESSYGGGLEAAGANLVTLNKCTFIQKNYYDHCSACVAVSSVNSTGKVIINSGSYTTENYCLYVYSSGGNLEVNGGKFSGEKNALRTDLDDSTYPQAVINVTLKGGIYTGTIEKGTNSGKKTITITGGTFTYDPVAYVPLVSHKVVENYKVVPATSFKVTFNANGGTCGTAYAYSHELESLPTPTRSGYTFAGWYTDEALTTAYDVNTAVTEDITLYAKWNAIIYDVPTTPTTPTTPSQPETSTETKPDGSTTTTETKPDGTVTESNTSKPTTDASGNTSQTTTETSTGKDGVTESKTETVTKPDGSASSTTESTTTKPDGTKTESTTETTVNKDGSTASTTTATTTNKDGTVTESKTEATTSTVTNKDGSTTETKQETTTTSTGSKTESTTVTTVNKDGSTTATTTATTTDKAGTVTESKTESTTNKDGTTTEKTTTTETKANGTVTESKTETTINTDGSSKATTTATVTKADGTKVESKTTATTSLSTNKTTGTVTETKKETTTTSDGVKSEGTTVTQIRKDGTVTSTETVKASDSTGTTATKTTTLDAKGEVTTTAEVSVSSKAVTEAAKTGVAVTIPVEVTATKSASTAPTVSVSVPKTAESVKVELPVQNVTPGTVAVIVNADGTEKIVSTSVVTDNGVALKLDGSATVKLVDNAKRFTDVPETNVFYNEISSLSARNIMIGVSNEKFDLHNSVTLDQVANVAGRITGAVDVKDFNAGVAWGKDGGLKTGNVSATRGDVLKALYIAAGSPAVEDTSILTRFKDASSIPADLAAIAAWAAQNGILKGNMDGTAGLSNNVTRGQACALAGRTMGTLA